MAATTPLDQATEEALRAHAIALGLDADETTPRDLLIVTIRQAGFGDRAVPTVEQTPRKAKAPRPAPVSDPDDAEPHGDDERALLDRAMITVLLPESDTAPEMEFVSVQGTALYIKRGTPQAIRFPFYVALRNAKRIAYAPSERNGLGPARTVPALPFSVLDMPEIVRRWESDMAARGQ